MATAALQSEPAAPSVEETFDPGLDYACDGRNQGRAVSLAHYLHTAYTPDCDYIDGHLEERNLGELDHGTVQGQIYFLFRLNAEKWKVEAVPEVRLQVKPSNFRIPDVMILHPGQKKTQIIREAPMLCVEVLSPEDTFTRLKKKVDDYRAMGVPHVWVFDPCAREAYICDRGGFEKVSTPDLLIPGTPITLNLEEVFSVLNDR